MTPSVLPIGDAPGFAAALRALQAGYVPEAVPRDRGPDAAVVQAAARFLQSVAHRLEQAPAKNELAFLERLGVRLVSAQPARAPVVMRLEAGTADISLPAGTRLASPPPPTGGPQIVFETERSLGVAAARLQDVVSLWPGRDEYIDHGADAREGRAVSPFDRAAFTGTPHMLYVAHGTLLALAGRAAVTVGIDLTTPSSTRLDIRWEYWDGEVWRPFRDTRPECSNVDPTPLDGTQGFLASGPVRLEAECAQTEPTTIAGIESSWIRGRLADPLPTDPARVLPELDAIRLSTEITRAYASPWGVTVRAFAPEPGQDFLPGERVVVRVLDAGGVPLAGVDAGVAESEIKPTDDAGEVDVAVDPDLAFTAVVLLDGIEQVELVEPVENMNLEVEFSLGMAALEAGATDGGEVDITKPFFPFGQQPQPGTAFYFAYEEAFSKPGARVRVYIQPTATPQDQLDETDDGNGNGNGNGGDDDDEPLDHLVSWDYYDGRRWRSLDVGTGPGAFDFTQRGFVDLLLRDDVAPVTVGDQEKRWLRARLASGGYGVIRSVTVDGTTLRYFEARPPAVADMRIGYTWQEGPLPPDHVVTYNDFQYADRSEAAAWPGTTFQPFTPVADATAALYLGFDGRLPVDSLGIFFDVVEQSSDTPAPALVWEYWDGITWERLTVDDETRNLRVPGVLGFIGPLGMAALARFGEPRHWIRGRLNEDGPPGEPELGAILPNATWAAQQQTIIDEPVGTVTGRPDQVLVFRQVPVLPDQRIEVRELAGPRANVEWRLLATELLADPTAAIQELETRLAAEGDLTDIERGPLRLRRDRYKRVTEVWVHWEERPSLAGSGPEDRHYALEHARGRLVFGDGREGRVPPLGASVLARWYRTGGGSAGNVRARTITQVLSPIGGLEAVFNPLPAEGGADAETPEQVAVRGPRSVRHRGRALTAEDYETLAGEASPSIAVARALPGRGAAGRRAPGWVTLVVIPHSGEPRPFPSFGLREHVRRYVADRAPADVVAALQIVVAGPRYQPVDVTATLVPVDPMAAGAVERAVHAAVADFLHPLRGGPAGRGWRPGEDVFVSDLASVVEGVTGVDHSRELAVMRAGMPQGDRLAIADDRLPVAGDIRIRLVGA